ncbi:hypothetical protein [Halobacillus sp. Marseille-Q1614]|uniref:hypothetical protein n=1 Tax=Halobacillus sp. Marseille-Q1614 TaxID=2709134 RepID=UPI00156DED35|nr:hypothetical protein [Halobacillus sp. Marseille-Q1614]
MKKFYSLTLILVLGLILGSCGTDETPEESADEPAEENAGENTEENADEGEGNELSAGVDSVIQSVEELGTNLEEDADVNTINEQGEALEEGWDQIEKDVEEQYPDRYTETEESLYPLIDEAKKDEPDVEKMKEWVQSTSDSLNQLKQEVDSEG